MIVDTSAIVAILLDEQETDRFVDALTSSGRNLISAGTWVESGIIITRRGRPELDPKLAVMRDAFRLQIEPVTAEQAEIARAAYRAYGVGSGHPARLNFGDCFAYALAKATGRPLLFKGDDFAATDVTPAVPLT